MNHLYLPLMALVSLALLIACQPRATPQTAPPAGQPVTPGTRPTAAATSASPTQPAAASATLLMATSTSTPSTGQAANADVLHVRAVQSADDTWTFYVTVRHPDTSWQDYADGWDVLTPDGTLIKPDPSSPFTRLLLHPHQDEQPFTRSQSGIVISPGVTQVRVRAHDLVDGFGGHEVVVDLSVSSGPDFEVERKP
jgi:hypothetical protein